MKILEWLVGKKFLKLVIEGNKTRKILKEGNDQLLQLSSPELENYYSKPIFMQAIPNPLSPGVLSVLFIIIYVCGVGGILAYFELSPPVYVMLSFSQVPVVAVCIVSMLWAIGRGNIWGLIVILYFYLSGLLLTVVSFILLFTIYFESCGGIEKLELIPVQLIVIFIARDIMNGEALIRLVSYYQLRRIAQEVYKIRNKLTERQKKK